MCYIVVMVPYITYCILFCISAVAAAGIAKLFTVLIKPGELLGGWIPWLDWNKVLSRLDVKPGTKWYYPLSFLHKRLGGCITCTRQLFADLSFLWLSAVTWYAPVECPVSDVPVLWLRMICYFMLYCGFSGIVLLVGQWLEYEKEQAENTCPVK